MKRGFTNKFDVLKSSHAVRVCGVDFMMGIRNILCVRNEVRK